MNIKIESNIPVPARARLGNRDAKYPFSEMEVGDSFRLPRTEAKRVRAAAYAHARKNGARFTTRTYNRGRGKFIRVWRVK